MTEHEFRCWATAKKGLTEKGATRWWRELKSTPGLQTDTKGRDPDGNPGCFRLWVPNAVERSGDQTAIALGLMLAAMSEIPIQIARSYRPCQRV
eukprot:3994773-Alexandrium_andersonii.AAC.1